MNRLSLGKRERKLSNDGIETIESKKKGSKVFTLFFKSSDNIIIVIIPVQLT